MKVAVIINYIYETGKLEKNLQTTNWKYLVTMKIQIIPTSHVIQPEY